MELSHGQKEYLLELLSAEYHLPDQYRPALKDAIKRYSVHPYTEEELDFLAAMPQSLTADLYLNRAASLSSYARRFALWLNTLEYNIYDDSPATAAFLPNPDPSSPQKLLQIIEKDDVFQACAVPRIYFQTPCRRQAAITTVPHERRLHAPAIVSIWEYRDIEQLMQEFLNFANQNPAKIPADYCDYLDTLEDNLQRTKENSLSWPQLRQKARQFAEIEPDYLFPDRSLGLITPSTLQFISLINSRPVKQAVKRLPASAPIVNPFAPEIKMLHKIKEGLKASSLTPPQPHFTPNIQSSRVPKLPSLPSFPKIKRRRSVKEHVPRYTSPNYQAPPTQTPKNSAKNMHIHRQPAHIYRLKETDPPTAETIITPPTDACSDMAPETETVVMPPDHITVTPLISADAEERKYFPLEKEELITYDPFK